MMIQRHACWLVCLLFVTVGCSDGRLETYPVKGKVVFPDGFAARVGTVELKSREHLVQARGDIQSDGTFTLSTYQPGDGAVDGTHDVVIVQFVMAEELQGFKTSSLGVIHPRYASYATSGLTATITPGSDNNVTLTVEGIKKKESQDPDKPHGHPKTNGEEPDSTKPTN